MLIIDVVKKIIIKTGVPWRNWLARSTVNREVGSSTLPGTVFFFGFLVFGLVGFVLVIYFGCPLNMLILGSI